MNRKLQACVIIALLLAVLFCCSLKWVAAYEIRSAFQKYGLDTITLTVDSAGFGSTKLSDIIIGENKKLTIAKARLTYTLYGLWFNHIDSITLDTMAIDGDTAKGELSLHGLDSAIEDNIAAASTTILPSYFFEPEHFFFDALTVTNGQIHMLGDNDMTIPFTLAVHKSGGYRIELESTGHSGTFEGYSIAGPKISGVLALLAKDKWAGTWKTEDITVNDATNSPSVVTMNGTITVDPSVFVIGINVKSTPELVDSNAEIQIRKRLALLNLKRAHLFWGDGIVEINNALIPFKNASAFKFSADVNNVAVAQLFPILIGKDATGSGSLSGTLNVSINHDGDVFFNDSLLTSDNAGTLAIPKQYIAAGSKQAKEAADFRYNSMKIRMDNNIPTMHINATGKTTQFDTDIKARTVNIMKKIMVFDATSKNLSPAQTR